ncbi:MAG: sensor domain-containing diguanylate cyclase [Candidatus Aureabacteria bacterium]|nr:sensor domain-containing diguanylate cyclase [Candidatus Auribacterota bacterium]
MKKTVKTRKKRSEKNAALNELWHIISQDKDPDALFSHALNMLSKFLGKIEAAIFVWAPWESVLRSQKVIRSNILQDGDEVIVITRESPLWGLCSGITDIVIERENEASICVALRTEGDFLGMLRITRLAGNKFSRINLSQVRLFCAELSITMNNLKVFLQNEKHVRQLRASFEISSNIVKSLHLNELLKLVVKSIVSHMGFDRVRLYLVDRKKQILKGEVSYDLRGSIQSLEKEEFPLKPRVHPLVDHILGDGNNFVNRIFHDVVVFVPLQVKDIVVGVLVVDNILSQQRITLEETQTTQSFAGQIAMAVENARLFEKIEELSITDSLTGLFVLRHFKERLETEVYRCKRYKTSIALFVIDIDDFKPINDTYGHPFGDLVLQSVTQSIKSILRQTDFACRYGGDEFMVCLSNIKKEDAIHLGLRLLETIRMAKPVPEAGSLDLSVSIGVAMFPESSEDIEDVLKKADQALYYSKEKGKGQISSWWDMKESKDKE